MFFEIDGLPLSTNKSLIAVNGRLIHSAAARTFKAEATLALTNQLQQQLRLNPDLKAELDTWVDQPLFCQVQVYSAWITKAGTIRKTDVSNREKLLIDCIFSVLNDYGFPVDDSQIYMMVLSKHEAHSEDKTVVMLNTLKDFNKRQLDDYEED